MFLNFKVSAKGIENYLIKGEEVRTTQRVDVDFTGLTVKERELILRHAVLYQDELYLGYFRKLDRNGFFISMKREFDEKLGNGAKIDGVSLSEIISTLQIWEENEQKAREEEVQREKTRTEKLIKEASDDLENYLKNETSWLYFSTKPLDKTRIYKDSVSKDSFDKAINFYNHYFPEKVKDMKIELERRIKAEETQKAEEAQKVEETKKAEEAKKTALSDWATKNGSELLKLRIEEKMNWMDLALEEYSESLVEDSESWRKIYDDDDDAKKYFDIQNATVEQIHKLREYRSKYPDAQIELVRVRFEDDYESYHKDYVRLNFIAPNGVNISRAIFLNNYPED